MMETSPTGRHVTVPTGTGTELRSLQPGQWLKGCESGHCVEVGLSPTGGRVMISATHTGKVVSVSAEEWTVFVDAVKRGEFDL